MLLFYKIVKRTLTTNSQFVQMVVPALRFGVGNVLDVENVIVKYVKPCT